jgi:heterotetrameric sarcosine oxidase delta subunit
VRHLSLIIKCPNCGERSAYEFLFGGEALRRPPVNASDQEWYNYAYGRKNIHGIQKEWCYHRFGCKRWFLVRRNTSDNTVLETFLPEDDREKEWKT